MAAQRAGRPWSVTAAVVLLLVHVAVFAVEEGTAVSRGRRRATDLVRGQVERHMSVDNDQAVLNGVTAALIVLVGAVVVALLRMTSKLAGGSRTAYLVALAITVTLLVARAVCSATGGRGRVDRAALPPGLGWLGDLGLGLEVAILVALLLPTTRRFVGVRRQSVVA